MKINLNRYAKLVNVLEFIFSDIAKNINGTFHNGTFRNSPVMRDCINTHLHYYKDEKHENETMVVYVARQLLEKHEVFIFGATVDSSIKELQGNPIFKNYKV